MVRKKFKLTIKQSIVLSLVVMMVASIFVYYFSTDSHVKVLSCKNNYYLSDSEVYDLANVSTKTRIFLMPSIILEKRVEKMPFVQSCDVSKKNRKLTFNVQEKLIIGYYVKDNKNYALCQDGSSIEIEEQYLNMIVHFPLLSNFNAKQRKQLCEQFQKHHKVLTRELIEKFADYGFNKAHAIAYGLIGYQLAYLKANYPLSFYGAILSNEQNSDVHKMEYIAEAKKYQIRILPPSINYSEHYFKQVEGDLRFSLLAIKNVGQAGYLAIVEERQKNGLFKDIFDFVSRMEGKKITSLMLESLIDAGAFDEFGLNRATLKANLEKITEYAHLKNMIGIDEPPILEIIKENKMVRLELEKKALGVYLTQHPLAYMKQKINQPILAVANLNEYVSKNVRVLLSLSRVKVIVDKKGNEMCFIEGFDETGNVEGVVFSSTYQRYKTLLEKNKIVCIEGKMNYRDKLSLVVQNVKEVNEV